MHCPLEIAGILASILEMGLLRIRSSGWAGQAERCAIEADHIHNLPGLIGDFSQERLVYYWQVERTAYLARTPEAETEGWELLWCRLQPYAEPAMKAPAIVR